MLVETAVHDTPMVAAVIDTPGGWDSVRTASDGKKRKYSLALKEIGDWPTHQRFRWAKAGRVAENEVQLADILNLYLNNPSLDATERRKFIEDEITYTDASAGKRTVKYLLELLEM